MSPRKAGSKNLKPRNLDVSTIATSGRKSKGVHKLSDFVTGEQSAQLSTLKDQTIYIVKLEPMSSEQFGDGFKIWYKDFPNAKETLQAHTFGQVTVPTLAQLYQNTHQGKLISLDSPIQATVKVSGRTTTLE
jgi:hypothetical protein